MSRPSLNDPQSEWLAALNELSLCCALDGPNDAEDRTREINGLLRLDPQAAAMMGVVPIDDAQLEALLAAGGAVAAVMAMFRRGVGYMLSRGCDDQSLATVSLPSFDTEETCAGATPALALIGALASALANGPWLLQVPAQLQAPARPTSFERPVLLH
jgi:hypothetical protein